MYPFAFDSPSLKAMTSVESGSFWQLSKSYLDDEILIKKLLLSHDPDGRRLDSEMLLSAVENIMFYATTSAVLVTSFLVTLLLRI